MFFKTLCLKAGLKPGRLKVRKRVFEENQVTKMYSFSDTFPCFFLSIFEIKKVELELKKTFFQWIMIPVISEAVKFFRFFPLPWCRMVHCLSSLNLLITHEVLRRDAGGKTSSQGMISLEIGHLKIVTCFLNSSSIKFCPWGF